jgi:hypothetical protein
VKGVKLPKLPPFSKLAPALGIAAAADSAIPINQARDRLPW